MRRFAFLLLIFISFSVATRAEIEKTALMCGNEICFYWWPKLSPPKGWHQDQDMSYEIEANALIPDGLTFSNTETVMYAKALYKPRTPETKSVNQLIADDKKEFLSADPSIIVAEAGDINSADGKKFRSFTFFPKNAGNWEQVSYGEEGDFYLIFAVSSKSKKGLEQTQATYKELISRYKE